MKIKLPYVLLPLMTLGLTSCGPSMGIYKDADKYVSGNIEYSDVEVNNIDIDWISGSLTLVEDESATGITIKEETNLTDADDLVHSYYHDGILSVKYFASGHTCSRTNVKKDLTITYKPDLDYLRVDLTSGKLNAENIHATTFVLDMTSGDSKIKNLVSNDVDIDATSGTVEIDKLTGKKLNVDITSGTIKTVFDTIETAKYDLTSGKIFMTLPVDGGTVKVSKTSGSVTANRECSINNDTYKFGTGSADIKVSMTSGKLTID